MFLVETLLNLEIYVRNAVKFQTESQKHRFLIYYLLCPIVGHIGSDDIT